MSKLAAAVGIVLSALAAGQAVAASFDAGGSNKTFSRADRSGAMSYMKSIDGGSSRATSTYCVWQDSGGNWKAKQVDLLTTCINSIKVTCTNGQCTT